MKTDLTRFLEAQQDDYTIALAEIKSGIKRSHWMWFIFPQIHGLGFSDLSKYYAIKNIEEAMAFLQHPVLGVRLKEICNALLNQPGKNAKVLIGSPDDMKLKSSMTSCAVIEDADSVFIKLLDKYFQGEKDEATLKLL